MPIYEYQLPDGSVIEKLRRWEDADKPLEDHPGAERVWSAHAFRSETLFRDHPETGQRVVYNDYDSPFEGISGVDPQAMVDKSREFSAKSDEAMAAKGLGNVKHSFEKARMIFT